MSKLGNASGFTLIELLVVIAIIGVLSAIALPAYSRYRSKAFDARAQADLHNVITAEEAYFVDYNTYSSALPLPGFVASDEVNISLCGSATDFSAETYHNFGTHTYSYDTSLGGGITTANGIGNGGGGAVNP